VVVPNWRICRDRFNPSLITATIFDVEVWGGMRLGYQYSLLPKTSEQVGFPHASMEIVGLAISGPALIRVGKGQINLVQ
jgi:hypothetical protein